MDFRWIFVYIFHFWAIFHAYSMKKCSPQPSFRIMTQSILHSDTKHLYARGLLSGVFGGPARWVVRTLGVLGPPLTLQKNIIIVCVKRHLLSTKSQNYFYRICLKRWSYTEDFMLKGVEDPILSRPIHASQLACNIRH